MFAVGTKELGNVVAPAQAEEERGYRALLRSCFTEARLLATLIEALPDASEMPPPLLPPGWEQRMDETSRHIFFVDHATCTTSWLDPREAVAKTAGADDDVGPDEEAGAADADLAALCVGLSAKGGIGDWARTLERSARDALDKAVGNPCARSDAEQFPRYILLQRLHHAVVRRHLTDPPEMAPEDRMWERRPRALVASGADHRLPIGREAVATLAKHAAGGLTATYKAGVFGPPKLSLRKVRKTLAAAMPAAESRLTPLPPSLPDKLMPQLMSLVLQPEIAGDAPTDAEVDMWSMAADSALRLGIVSGSLLTLLQLPRAVWCRGIPFVATRVGVCDPIYHLQQRCSERAGLMWRGYEYWVGVTGALAVWDSPGPGEAETLAAEDGAVCVIVGAATLASAVWCRLAEKEEVAIPDAGGVDLTNVLALVDVALQMADRVSACGPDMVTPQQVTEMWQPLAVELRGDTLLCLISLLVALLSGNRSTKELASALCTLRLLTVHLLLLHRARIDATTMLTPPPPADGASDGAENRLEQLRASFVERLFKVLMVPLTDVQVGGDHPRSPEMRPRCFSRCVSLAARALSPPGHAPAGGPARAVELDPG